MPRQLCLWLYFRAQPAWRRDERKSFGVLSVTGWKVRERLAVPVAEIRDVQTSRSRPLRLGPGKPL